MKAAAKRLRSDIKLVESLTEENLIIDAEPEMESNILPYTLELFLEQMAFQNGNVGVAVTGQLIMQAAQPRVFIAPLSNATNIQYFLIDILHCLGLCSSYKEVQALNESAAVEQGTAIPSYNGEFVQQSERTHSVAWELLWQ